MQWDGTPNFGDVVYYQCEEGYYTRGLRNYSACGENGLWEEMDLSCEGATFYDPKKKTTDGLFSVYIILDL